MLTTVYGNDPAIAIAEYARVSGITGIVLGKSPGRRRLFTPKETLMSRLNELAPDVEIIIVPNRLTVDTRRFSLRSLLQRERFSLADILFEASSAMGTVGVSAVGTPNLHAASRAVLIPMMFLGRVGPLTLAIAVARRQNRIRSASRYPEEKIMIG